MNRANARYHGTCRSGIAAAAAFLAAASLAIGVPAARGQERVVAVGAASDVQPAFDDLAAGFGVAHPGITLRPSFGSSGTLYAQIESRAPFDVFLSADVDYARRVRERGQALDPEFVYAQGHVALWVSQSLALDLEAEGLGVLRDTRIRRLAIANPRHAPYGRAAETALRSGGVYDDVKSKLVLGDNVAQAAHFARSGAADAALVSLSLARSPAMQEKGASVEVRLDVSSRFDQAGVILSWAQDPGAARAFRDFLCGPQGRAILAQHGLGLVEP